MAENLAWLEVSAGPSFAERGAPTPSFGRTPAACDAVKAAAVSLALNLTTPADFRDFSSG
jgi:hypothetical protein